MTGPKPIPMVGKTYGGLRVLAEAGRRYYPTANPQRLVLVQCKCGHVYETLAQHVRRNIPHCEECRAAEQSVRLSDGRTIGQIAAAAGLKIGTVYRRFLRGWPDEYLGLERHPGGRRYGGTIDLPERRRTTRPDVRGT